MGEVGERQPTEDAIRLPQVMFAKLAGEVTGIRGEEEIGIRCFQPIPKLPILFENQGVTVRLFPLVNVSRQCTRSCTQFHDNVQLFPIDGFHHFISQKGELGTMLPMLLGDRRNFSKKTA